LLDIGKEIMQNRKPAKPKVIVVMPAYNAEQTLEKTYRDIPEGSVDEVLLIDDASMDRTAEIAGRLGITVIKHDQNKGYGGNQKTCYDNALKKNADIIAMVHPDYQYDPRVIPFAVGFIQTGICDIIIGTRIRTRRETLEGGMPVYKYISNRILTSIENSILGQNLGDFHSGFRVYKREVLEKINFHENSDDFIFDTELLTQAVHLGFRIGDIPIPTRYAPEASSINFRRALKYGIQTLIVMAKFILHRTGIFHSKLFKNAGVGPNRDIRTS
jgi:glycosyltransferase involved in cell wall biosynthesis